MRLFSQTIQLNPNKKLWLTDEYEVPSNKIIGIFGESGCGKTSFLEYLYRHYSTERIVYMKQDIVLHPYLTTFETLWFYTALRCPDECHSIEKILKQLNMTHLIECQVGGLSGGEKKRVMIAYHLLDHHAQIFLLDEPFSGIDSDNTDMIFSLLREKCSRQCTILMTAHQLPFTITQQLDEKWNFVSEDPTMYRLEINPNVDCFSEIPISPYIPITMKPASLFQQWKYLFLRDRMLEKRQWTTTILKWTVPLFVVLLQNIFIGSFSMYLKQWEHSGQMMDLFKVIVMHTILLFTVSMIPMHLLNDHFQKRSIIHHETSQKIYHPRVYLSMAVFWDQFSLWVNALCIVLILMPPDELFLTTFFNIMMEMNFTNMLMWLCSIFNRSSFNTTLIIVSSYLSISFIGNMGMLLRNKSLDIVQYTSMTHVQENVFLEKLFQLFPQQQEQLNFIVSCLNIHGRLNLAEWLSVSMAMWFLLILMMIFPFLFV